MRILKIMLLSIFILGIALYTWSCVGEDVTARQQTTPAATLKPLPDTVYLRGQQPASLTFEIKTPNGSGADRIEKVDFYKSIKLPTDKEDSFARSQEIFLTSVSQVPSQLEITIQELIAGTAYNSENDIPGGAIWDIRWEIKLKSGKLLRPTDTTQISFRCTSSILTNLDEIATYVGTNDGCSPEPVMVTIQRNKEATNTNSYIISDMSSGYLENCNGGVNAKVLWKFSESCGIITSKEIPKFSTYLLPVQEGTKWDEATKTLTIVWKNTSEEDKIITSTFVRQ